MHSGSMFFHYHAASSAMMYWLFIFHERSMWNGRANSKWVNSIISFKRKTKNIKYFHNHKQRRWIYFVLNCNATVWVSRFYNILFSSLDGVGYESFFDYFGPDNPVSIIFLRTFYSSVANLAMLKVVMSWTLNKYEFISIGQAFIYLSDVDTWIYYRSWVLMYKIRSGRYCMDSV